jgi:hypothetical protein
MRKAQQLEAQLAQAHRRIAQVEGWLEDKCIELGRLTETYEICHADHLHALKGNEQLDRQLAQCQQKVNQRAIYAEGKVRELLREKDALAQDLARLRREQAMGG